MVGISQEVPPPGGYGPIDWAKPLKTKALNGWAVLGAFAVLTGVSSYYWVYFKRARLNKIKREMTDARIAVSPLFYAEMDRFLCKQLRANRDEEAELMQKYPEWKVGTFWGEPVYYNPREKFNMPSLLELYAHSDVARIDTRVMEKLQH